MGCLQVGRSLILIPGGHRNKTPAPPGCGYVRLSLLAAAVSRAQLREGSAPSNHDFDSTPAGVCVTVKRGLWMAARGCEARSPRHAGPRSLVTASASWHDSPAAGGCASCRPTPSQSPAASSARSAESWGMPAVRLIKHEAIPGCGSFEVRFDDGRLSVYFEDLPGRRLGPDLVTSEVA
jgi:hypothetical protein